jgi:trehalose 6-phosphate synthase
MRRAIRFLAVLLAGLTLLAVLGYVVVTRTIAYWFSADLEMRARLAVAAARQSLAGQWPEPLGLAATLADIAHDERIMAAAACSMDGERLAATDAYPDEFTCRSVLERMRSEAPEDATTWSMMPELPSGPVHLSATLLADGRSVPLGAVVLVHDLSYLGRREATARNLWLLAFCVLAIGAPPCKGGQVTFDRALTAWREPTARAMARRVGVRPRC